MNSATLYKKPFFRDHSGSEKTIAGKFLFVKQLRPALALVSEDNLRPPVVHNLDNAKSCLQGMKLSELPELIIIDTPLNLKDLTFFRNWLTQNLIPPIPIIYKERCLNPAEVKKIFTLNLVDDVIKSDADASLLLEKIRFFKSLATQSLIDPTFGAGKGKTPEPRYRKFFKRVLDISLSLLILLVMTPLLLCIAILIKLTSRGSVLYISKRAGEGFNVFNFYKFRTMVTGAEEMMNTLHSKNMYHATEGDPCFFKVSNDPRVTKIGHFLRNTSLDELPQLLNVLRGDMSLVGNRPLPIYEAATLTTRKWAERFMAPAGITGLWQISKRGKSIMSVEERISMDITYARKRSTRRDLKILLSTPLALIQRQSQ